MAGTKSSVTKYLKELEELIPRITRKHFVFIEKSANLQELEITLPQINVLSLLLQKNYTMSELSEELSLALNTVSGNVDILVRDKLVERIADKEDRRVVWVKLTKKGREKIEKFLKFRRKQLTKIFSNITEKDRQQLVDNLKSIDTILQKAKDNL